MIAWLKFTVIGTTGFILLTILSWLSNTLDWFGSCDKEHRWSKHALGRRCERCGITKKEYLKKLSM